MVRPDESLFVRRGPLCAAALAVVAGGPGLGLPFLSDDWGHLAAVSAGVISRTPFGYFRPLCSIAYWLEWQAFGLRSLPFHLVSVTFAAVTAALVVVLLRRYSDDRSLATIAGILFALHPYHIENVAWIAGFSDVLSGLCLCGAALSYDRWRARPSGLPFTALVLFEAALLSKESAIVLPFFLLVVAAFDNRRRPTSAEWIRGYLPLVAIALAHFILLRPLFLGDLSLNPLNWIGNWERRLYFFLVSSLTPAQTERLEAAAIAWGLIAAGVGVALVCNARLGSGRVPGIIWPAGAAFVVLLGPSLVSFQQRFLFLPSAAAAVGTAALLRAGRRRVSGTLGALLVVGWIVAAYDQWAGWFTAANASNRLMSALVRVAGQPGVGEIIVAAMPHRVAGAPVRADFTAALSLGGHFGVQVLSATEVDYPSDSVDALAAPQDQAIDRLPDSTEIRLAVPRTAYSRYVWPLVPQGANHVQEEWGEIIFERDGSERTRLLRLRVRIRAREGRAVLVWSSGRLKPV